MKSKLTVGAVVNYCYIFGIQPKMNYNRYGVNIISLIPSPLVGEG